MVLIGLKKLNYFYVYWEFGNWFNFLIYYDIFIWLNLWVICESWLLDFGSYIYLFVFMFEM